jgi:hypothetical protein
MFKILYPSQDTTILEASATLNAGLDEILAIGKSDSTGGTNYLKSRSLVKFDITQVNTALTKYNVAIENCKFFLQLYTTHAVNLPSSYTIEGKVLGDDWDNGLGYVNSSPIITDGCTWSYPKSGSYWTSGSQNQEIAGGSNLIIKGLGYGGSFLEQSPNSGLQLEYSQSFTRVTDLDKASSTRNTDIYMDVTSAIRIWQSGSNGVSIPNNGFLLQFSDTDEASVNKFGSIKFFSRETHTIYVPKLLMLFDKSSFSTGSLSEFNIDSYKIYTDLQKEYKDTSVNKVRIFARDRYPQKSPTNLFPEESVKFLPTGSLYSIRDAGTEEVVIPFNETYTKISCDSTSNFINLDMSGLMPERYYRLCFKVTSGIYEEFIEDDFYFKIVR